MGKNTSLELIKCLEEKLNGYRAKREEINKMRKEIKDLRNKIFVTQIRENFGNPKILHYEIFYERMLDPDSFYRAELCDHKNHSNNDGKMKDNINHKPFVAFNVCYGINEDLANLIENNLSLFDLMLVDFIYTDKENNSEISRKTFLIKPDCIELSIMAFQYDTIKDNDLIYITKPDYS